MMCGKSAPSDVKMAKKLNFVAAILDWEWVFVKHVLYINNLYQYYNTSTFITKWSILPFVIFYNFFTIYTGSSYLQIIPLILNQFWPNLVYTYKIHF